MPRLSVALLLARLASATLSHRLGQPTPGQACLDTRGRLVRLGNRGCKFYARQSNVKRRCEASRDLRMYCPTTCGVPCEDWVPPPPAPGAIAVGEAFGQLCFWLRHPSFQAACPAPWASARAMNCLEAGIAQRAASQNASAAALVGYAIDHCVPRNNSWRGVDLQATAQGRGCPRTPRTWMALQVRNQAREVPYWLLWHLALGVSHFVVYDNDDRSLTHDARDSRVLRKLLHPFEQKGFVTIVDYSGREGGQVGAYADAHEKAHEAGAAFLGAMDLDEFLVPFEDECATTLLRRCNGRRKCGAIQLNWRAGRPRKDVLEPDRSASFWRTLDYDGGVANKHTKSFFRVGEAYGGRGKNPHYANLAPGWGRFRDDGATPVRGLPHFVTPAEYDAQRAVVYHAHKTSLLAWVDKKSMRGRATVNMRRAKGLDEDLKNRLCPSCFASLPRIAHEYYHEGWLHPTAARPPPSGDVERKIAAFVASMDAFMERLPRK